MSIEIVKFNQYAQILKNQKLNSYNYDVEGLNCTIMKVHNNKLQLAIIHVFVTCTQLMVRPKLCPIFGPIRTNLKKIKTYIN